MKSWERSTLQAPVVALQETTCSPISARRKKCSVSPLHPFVSSSLMKSLLTLLFLPLPALTSRTTALTCHAAGNSPLVIYSGLKINFLPLLYLAQLISNIHTLIPLVCVSRQVCVCVCVCMSENVDTCMCMLLLGDIYECNLTMSYGLCMLQWCCNNP